MLRRTVMATALAAVIGAPALAQTDHTGPVLDRIQAEGFAVSKVQRTLLGRILIVSQNRTNMREVVLDRHTGAILRDRLFALPEPAPQRPSTQPNTPGPSQTGDAPASADTGNGADAPGNGSVGGGNGGNGKS